MKRIAVLFVVACISACFLSACGGSERSFDSGGARQDKMEVYDADGRKILKTSDQDVLDYFSNIIGMSAEELDEENYQDFVKDVPEDAKVSYHYVFSTKREDGKTGHVDFYVYENYPYITMKGMPAMGSLTWQLSKEAFEKVNDVEDMANGK
ncbi:MAG: hypothetical protein SPI65_04700 [Peptoniphilus sp.]|nr:hypothetical protein [Peptoniphilus sp.]MDD7362894.1 hypothetical protein [Bacillota bacterium]MDY6044865.1 hypothetical protein [Peptoniphilus sp.]